FEIFTASNSKEAISIYNSKLIDLFILDVDLSLSNSDMSGIDIGIHIRTNSRYNYTPIIYITGVPEKICNAVNDVHCFSYISKPYTTTNVYKALDDIIYSPLVNSNRISICTLEDIHMYLDYDNIMYIDCLNHTSTFYTINGTFSTRSITLRDIMAQCPTYFLRIHKSYIANVHFIDSYKKNEREITITGNKLPVGRSYKEMFESIYLKGEKYEF
ncbi:MAG: response regulator transcription factor, partial [Lachnospiraceae bacterium]|nr:response regulator transcription factor [Lachnospiraceae bacterium]